VCAEPVNFLVVRRDEQLSGSAAVWVAVHRCSDVS
jgi:hypothetical protein